MKILRSAVLALTIGVACISSAQARDSFSFGLNIGGYGYPPPVYYAPPVTYYNPPVVYYSAAPRYYNYEPAVSFGYFDDGFRGHRRGWSHEEHEEHEHGGWGHEGRGRGGWDHDGDRHERRDWH